MQNLQTNCKFWGCSSLDCLNERNARHEETIVDFLGEIAYFLWRMEIFWEKLGFFENCIIYCKFPRHSYFVCLNERKAHIAKNVAYFLSRIVDPFGMNWDFFSSYFKGKLASPTLHTIRNLNWANS